MFSTIIFSIEKQKMPVRALRPASFSRHLAFRLKNKKCPWGHWDKSGRRGRKRSIRIEKQKMPVRALRLYGCSNCYFFHFYWKTKNAREGIETPISPRHWIKETVLKNKKCPWGHWDELSPISSFFLQKLKNKKCPWGHWDTCKSMVASELTTDWKTKNAREGIETSWIWPIRRASPWLKNKKCPWGHWDRFAEPTDVIFVNIEKQKMPVRALRPTRSGGGT